MSEGIENTETTPVETEVETTTEVVEETAPEPVEATPEATPQTEESPAAERIHELTERAKRAEAQAEYMRQMEYARNPQAAGQQVAQQPQHVFDEATDRGVQELITRGRQEDQQRIGNLEAQLIVKTMEGRHKDWSDHEEGVFQRLRGAGLDKVQLGGVEQAVQLAETLFLAEKAAKGGFSREAQAQTEETQRVKAAAAVPTRATERKPEVKSWDDMTTAERDDYSANLKYGP